MFTTNGCYNLSKNIPGFDDLLNMPYEKENEPELSVTSSCINTQVTNVYFSGNILKTTECVIDNRKYKLIRYNKNFLSNDLVSSYGLCRSVIVNQNNKVIGFAPPKSISSESFINKYQSSENVVAKEYVDGTMINVFWDDSVGLTGAWQIATRNNIGATNYFFIYPNKENNPVGNNNNNNSNNNNNNNNNSTGNRKKTFRDMFLEAATVCGLDLNRLQQSYCYSFVLQHPENRIVVPFNKPQLYLVAVYNIQNAMNDVVVQSIKINDVVKQEFTTTTILFPETYDLTHGYSSVIDKYASMNTPYYIMGVVFYNNVTGERTKVRNPVYEEVRHLRGNQPKLQYQYLSLRREGKVGDFLKFYPEFKREFSDFRDRVHLYTKTLHENYISCYVKKEKALIHFAENYRTNMYNIHQLYLNDLREKKMHVTNSVVINYVNNMHPSLLMYCLNYNMIKRSVDVHIVENSVV